MSKFISKTKRSLKYKREKESLYNVYKEEIKAELTNLAVGEMDFMDLREEMVVETPSSILFMFFFFKFLESALCFFFVFYSFSIILLMFKFFIWKYKGVASESFYRIFSQYKKVHQPFVVLIIEPQVSGIKADAMTRSIGFMFSHRIESMGFKGGIWMIWNSNISLIVLVNSWQFVQIVCRKSSLLLVFIHVLNLGHVRSSGWIF